MSNTTDALWPLVTPVALIVWFPSPSDTGSVTVVVKFPLPSLLTETKALPSTATFTCSLAPNPVPFRFA